jgi:hypothetical protein
MARNKKGPIRSLIKLVVFAGIVFSAGRFVSRKKEEYAELTESQARAKLMEKMAPKVGDDTAGEIADKVIPKMRDRGLIKSDPIEEVADVTETAEQIVED